MRVRDEVKALLCPAMRTAGRYDSHNEVCSREGAHVKVRVGMRAVRGVDTSRRVSDAGSDLEAILIVDV